MNPRTFIKFFRTPTGRLVGFLAGGAVLLLLARGCRSGAPARATVATATNAFVHETHKRSLVPLETNRPPRKTAAPASSAPAPEPLPPISLYAATESEPIEPELSGDYAPFGRLVQGVLFITIDSGHSATPILGLVTEDLWHAGRLIIPAGTEIHGRAQPDRARDRIAGQNTWTFVWTSGLELTVSGIVLDHEPQPGTGSWDLRDGSPGLRGDLVKADNLAEWKVFLSTAIAAAADALKDHQTTVLGTQILSTGKNAALAGTSQVLNQYAQQLLDTMVREGFYVRVPAGKKFMLYVTQPIDLSQARVGSTRFRPETRRDAAASEPSRAPGVSTFPVSSATQSKLTSP